MFQATFNSIGLTPTGDIKATITYSNGSMNITEDETNANASSIKATILSRLAQLQAAEDFVNTAPTQPFTTLV